MRKYLLSSVFCGLCVLGIQAQVTLKGVAVKMNSDFTPVAGVEVVVQGGVPTLTDGAGTFILKLPHMESGDLLFDIRISKQGMEIVNLKEVEQWVASGDILYKVVLCPKGYIEQSRRKFYNIGKSYYQREYERKLQVLRVTRDLLHADIATFEQEMSQLSQEYDKRMKLLDYYADKFARINKDELSAMERQAMALVEKGDIDGAIHIYEASGIVEQFSNKMAQRDSLQQSLQTTRRLIKQQLEWYEKEGGSVSQEKAIQLIQKKLEEGKEKEPDPEKERVEGREQQLKDVPDRDMEKELKEAIEKNDYEKMAQLKEEGYKPSEEVIRGLGGDVKIDETQAIVIEKLFGTKPEVQKEEETVQKKEDVKIENVNEEKKVSTPELDKEFKIAVEKGDFAKLADMKEKGYKPSQELMQSLSETTSSNTMIAVQKIYGIKSASNTLGDVKLAHGPQKTTENDLKRPIANTVNRMFSDL